MTHDRTAGTTVKRLKPGKNRDEASPCELAGIIALNSDQTRFYPEIDHRPAAGRSKMILAAAEASPGRLNLCRKITRIIPLIRNRRTDRMPVTITKSLQWIANNPQPVRKTPQAAVVAPRSERMSLAAGAN
jgi:hypothetical protein